MTPTKNPQLWLRIEWTPKKRWIQPDQITHGLNCPLFSDKSVDPKLSSDDGLINGETGFSCSIIYVYIYICMYTCHIRYIYRFGTKLFDHFLRHFNFSSKKTPNFDIIIPQNKDWDPQRLWHHSYAPVTKRFPSSSHGGAEVIERSSCKTLRRRRCGAVTFCDAQHGNQRSRCLEV